MGALDKLSTILQPCDWCCRPFAAALLSPTVHARAVVSISANHSPRIHHHAVFATGIEMSMTSCKAPSSRRRCTPGPPLEGLCLSQHFVHAAFPVQVWLF